MTKTNRPALQLRQCACQTVTVYRRCPTCGGKAYVLTAKAQREYIYGGVPAISGK
jgi:hypothetical protein